MASLLLVLRFMVGSCSGSDKKNDLRDDFSPKTISDEFETFVVVSCEKISLFLFRQQL